MGGLALAAGVALMGVVGVAQQPQEPAQGGGQGRAERPWGQEGGRGERRGGGRRGGFGPFGGRMAERLNLTDAQMEQMRQIEERYRATFEAQRGGERRGERGERVDPFAGGAFDEAAVRAAAQARANAQVEREVAHARMMHEIYNVLTAEQKTQLAAEREQGRRGMRQRRGDRQPQPQLQ